MRFLHTADWHIGKKLHGYDLLAEQEAAFRQILTIAEAEQVEAIVIAGDLYDRSVPSVEAVEVFNRMIIELNLTKRFPIYAISGNHDSSTRLETGGPWFQQTEYYLHTQLAQAFRPIETPDVQFFLLPYFEPIQARLYFEDDEIHSIEQAMVRVIAELERLFDPQKAHVLVSHFFVAGSEKSDSETKVAVGGLDVVPLSLLQNFDYVALGHLHGKDALKASNARYSGSPVKFSLSELDHQKGVWIVDSTPQATAFTFKELTPLHDIKQYTASFQEFLQPSFYEAIDREAFLSLQLTDRAIIPNMMNQLRTVYPRILQVERLNGREQSQSAAQVRKEIRQLGPLELFQQFFTEVTDETLTTQQNEWLQQSLLALQTEEGK